jgi:hypothetical protein
MQGGGRDQRFRAEDTAREWQVRDTGGLEGDAADPLPVDTRDTPPGGIREGRRDVAVPNDFEQTSRPGFAIEKARQSKVDGRLRNRRRTRADGAATSDIMALVAQARSRTIARGS